MKKKITSVLFLITFTFTYNLQAQTVTSFTTANGLPHNNVNCVAIDTNDDVWLGTQSGVAKYDGTDWTYFTTDDGLLHNTISCITVDSQGNVWAGTDYGVCKYNGSTWSSYTAADGLGNNWVKYIAEDADGNIWIGTMTGLSKFDGVSTWENFTTGDGLPGGVCFITVDAQGNKWLGTFLWGMVKYDDTEFTTFTTEDSLPDNNNIRAIAIDDQNYKWVATSQGISVFDNNDEWVTNYMMDDGLFTEAVKDIDIDSEGNLWIGTYTDYLNEGAVNKFDGTDWVYFEVDQDQTIDSLISIVIRRLAIDSEDNIWVATGNGLSKISGANAGITENYLSADFRMYPNPANDHICIYAGESQTVEIYDVAMQKVAVHSCNGEKHLNISLDSYAGGVYFVRTGNTTKKLIVIH